MNKRLLSGKQLLRIAAVCCLLLVAPPSLSINFDLGKLKNTFAKAKQATATVSDEEEIKIGGMVASTLLGAAPLVEHAELQRYVNHVGMWVAQHTDRAQLPWTFGVIASDNINAFATPGGYIVVTQGLFLALNSEAELAAVLGHEIAHVLQRHHLNAMKKDAKMDLLGDLVVTAAGDAKKQQKLDKLVNAGTQLYARGLDRQDEYAADRMGVVLAARAGYDPYALLDVLVTLDSMSPDDQSLALLTKTHPPFSERIKLLDGAVEGGLAAYALAPRLESRLFKIQQALVAATTGKSSTE